nr:NUDIX domain-containing protein [Desulfobacterales bacterium]
MQRFYFCPRCGGRLKDVGQSLKTKAGEKVRKRLKCSSCGRILYENPIVGVAAILLDGDSILLARRKGTFSGQWCIPCGYVEYDEDVREAAKREFWEETGLEVEIREVFDVHSNFHDPECHTVGIWFLADCIGGELRPGDDVSEVSFFPLKNLPGEIAFPTDRLVLDKLKKSVCK